MRGVRQRRPSVKVNRQRDTRSWAVSEGIDFSLIEFLIWTDGKRKSTAKIHRTRRGGEAFGCATKHGPKNENAPRVGEA